MVAHRVDHMMPAAARSPGGRKRMNATIVWRREEAPRESPRHQLDAVYAELMETVLAQERSARREDRIDAIVRYANPDGRRECASWRADWGD
jgi:hypothetical protein